MLTDEPNLIVVPEILTAQCVIALIYSKTLLIRNMWRNVPNWRNCIAV